MSDRIELIDKGIEYEDSQGYEGVWIPFKFTDGLSIDDFQWRKEFTYMPRWVKQLKQQILDDNVKVPKLEKIKQCFTDYDHITSLKQCAEMVQKIHKILESK